MKKSWIFLTLLFAVLAFVGCSDGDDEVVEPQLEVNAHNLSGVWQLETWNNGQPLEQGLHLYLELQRRDNLFRIYDNLDSFQTTLTTGVYYFDTDPAVGTIIRGVYDYGRGDWNHRYVITSLTASRMVWVATDDVNDVSVYVRTELPEEIQALFPAE